MKAKKFVKEVKKWDEDEHYVWGIVEKYIIS